MPHGDFTVAHYGAAVPSHLARSRPFTRQIDLVFTESPSLEELAKISISYVRCKTRLVDFVQFARPLIEASESESHIIAFSIGAGPDAWSVDQRGLLTLRVCKETYERLGLTGDPLRNKTKDAYLISIPLRISASSAKVRDKHQQALLVFDTIQEEAIDAAWDVLYHCTEQGASLPHDTHPVRPTIRRTDGIHVPPTHIGPRPSDADEAEDWDVRVSGLFEWTALAALGSQRLQLHDRVDPLVAVYEPPPGSVAGSIVHMQWRGLLAPAFVQSILDAVSAALADPTSEQSPLISVTGHSFSSPPVNYLPSRLASNGNAKEQHVKPEACYRAEDTWSLLSAKGGCVLAQSTL